MRKKYQGRSIVKNLLPSSYVRLIFEFKNVFVFVLVGFNSFLNEKKEGFVLNNRERDF
jgi:hypothetical protein